MRKKGAVSPIKHYRKLFITQAYKQLIKTMPPPITLWGIATRIANMPTPEFYISEKAATDFLRGRSNNLKSTSTHRTTCLQAFRNIYERIKQENPKLTKMQAIRQALKHPAPNCAIAPMSIFRTLIYPNK